MPRYRDIRERPTQVLDLTSLLPDEFELIVPPFERCFQAHMDQWTMKGKPRTSRRHSTYTNCPLPSAQDRLLFVLAYLKHAPTQAYHGTTFGLIQSSVSTWLNILIPVLHAALVELGDAPTRTIAALRQLIGLETAEQSAASPFFTMALNDPSRAPKTQVNRRTTTAARKSATRSRTTSW
jgi:Helix-turn-helix of DDE superfamily endonuclease